METLETLSCSSRHKGCVCVCVCLYISGSAGYYFTAAPGLAQLIELALVGAEPQEREKSSQVSIFALCGGWWGSEWPQGLDLAAIQHLWLLTRAPVAALSEKQLKSIRGFLEKRCTIQNKKRKEEKHWRISGSQLKNTEILWIFFLKTKYQHVYLLRILITCEKISYPLWCHRVH